MAVQNSETLNWKNQAFPTNSSRNPRCSRIIAKSFYREMKRNGFSRNEILEVSSEILGLVTNDLKETRKS